MLDHVKASSSQCGGSRGPTHGMVLRMGRQMRLDGRHGLPGALGAADDLSGSPARWGPPSLCSHGPGEPSGGSGRPRGRSLSLYGRTDYGRPRRSVGRTDGMPGKGEGREPVRRYTDDIRLLGWLWGRKWRHSGWLGLNSLKQSVLAFQQACYSPW